MEEWKPEYFERLVEEAVRKAVGEAIKKELADLYIEREEHFLDHQFVSKSRKWIESMKMQVTSLLIKLIVGSFVTLSMSGLLYWVLVTSGKIPKP